MDNIVNIPTITVAIATVNSVSILSLSVVTPVNPTKNTQKNTTGKMYLCSSLVDTKNIHKKNRVIKIIKYTLVLSSNMSIIIIFITRYGDFNLKSNNKKLLYKQILYLMRRYRFPGEVPVPKKCNEPKICRPYISIKSCPRPPFIRDKQCRPNIYDRAIVHYVPEELKCKYDARFLLETFTGLILIPKNLDKFCGYNFKDEEVVAVEAEVIQCVEKSTTCETECADNIKCVSVRGADVKCNKTCEETCEKRCVETPCKIECETKCEKPSCRPKCEGKCITKTVTDIVTTTPTVNGAIPVKIFRILRVWKFEKQTLVGTVLPSVDSNGVKYHIIRQNVDLATGTPFATIVDNVLVTQSYVINYELFNIMDVNDPQRVMVELEGRVIRADYVDYGQETSNRLGIPIVVFNYSIVG
jgi:hypothetical protein